jgi:hypothetical protein
MDTTPLPLIAGLALLAWAGLFLKLWLETRAPRPRYRREGRELHIDIMATDKRLKR